MNIGRAVDKSSWFGRLGEAAKKGDAQVIQTILSNSVDESINSQDLNGNTALMLAAEEGRNEIVRMLLNNHQINSKLEDKAGWTALMCATSKNNCDIVKLLLDHEDTELHMANLAGRTALDLAASDEIKVLIRDKAPVVTPTLLTSKPARAVSNCWLTAHLEHSGFDPVVVKDCVQKLVHQEGFVSEADFAACSTTDINKAYLVDIGVQGLGLQRHLLKLHNELRALYTQQTAPTSPHQASLSAGSAVGHQPMICTPEAPPPTHSFGSVSGYSFLGSVFDCEAGAVFGEGSVCRKRDRAEASMEDSVPAH
eukprot:gene14091-16202_t